MTSKLAFRLAVIAAVAMLAVTPLMAVTARSCHPLPMSALTAFELVRSVDDLQRIFGMAGDACRAPLVEQMDHANLIDAIVYIPTYTAFYALVLFALGRRDRMIGWIGVAVALTCAVADWFENAGLFQLSAAPDVASVWLTVLIVATNVKWVGLGLATTIGGVMLLRRGGLGWLGFLACVAPLGTSLWTVISPDAGGAWLIVGMTLASVMLLAVALWGSFAKERSAVDPAAPQG